MFCPDVFLHAAYAGAVVGRAYLWLLAVAADVEPLEIYENLAALGKVSVQAALVYGDDNGRGVVLQRHLLIDVAAHVVASDTALYHDVLVYLLVLVGRREYVRVFLYELSYGDDVLLLQAVVAIRRCAIEVGLVPVTVHAR